jgi:hypothetical protein
MPFTFARWLDPMIQAPTIQTTIVGAIVTIGFVKPDKDASHGAVWAALQDWDWVTHARQASGMVYLRRFALRPSKTNPLGVMWVGAQLNGVNYRITFDALGADERARMGRLLNFAGLNVGRCSLGADGLGFRARSIRRSNWAGKVPPAAVFNDADYADDAPPAPPAPISGEVYFNVNAPQQQSTEVYFNEVMEDEAEEAYSNA